MSRGRKGFKNGYKGSNGSGNAGPAPLPAPAALPETAVLPETAAQEREKAKLGIAGYLTQEDLIADCRRHANDDYPGMFGRSWTVITGPAGQVQSTGAFDPIF
jgi:hypothetical protein